MLPIRWLEERIGGVAVRESLGGAVEHQLLLPDAIGGVRQMNEAGAVMSLLNVGVRLLP